LLGQFEQELKCLIGNAIFAVVEEQADGLGGQASAACGVVVEELAELEGLDGFCVGGEGLPGRTGG